MNITFKTLLNLVKLSGAKISDITDNSFYCPQYQENKVKDILTKIGYSSKFGYSNMGEFFVKGEHKVFVKNLLTQTEYSDYMSVTEFTYEV